MGITIRIVMLMFVFAVGVAWNSHAEDTVATQTQVFRGKVKSADKKSVTIIVTGQGEMSIPRSSVVKLEVEPPPSILQGLKDYEAGNMKKAQQNLMKVAGAYVGLDEDWAIKALLYYGRASLANGDYEKAEGALKQFMQAYEDEPSAVAAKIGLVEIAVTKKEYDKALVQFRELAETYDQQLKPAKDQLHYAGAIYLGIGKCLEEQSNIEDALLAYETVVALYPSEAVYAEALYRAATLSLKLGQTAKAQSKFKELAELYGTTDFGKKAKEQIASLGAVEEDKK